MKAKQEENENKAFLDTKTKAMDSKHGGAG